MSIQLNCVHLHTFIFQMGIGIFGYRYFSAVILFPPIIQLGLKKIQMDKLVSNGLRNCMDENGVLTIQVDRTTVVDLVFQLTDEQVKEVENRIQSDDVSTVKEVNDILVEMGCLVDEQSWDDNEDEFDNLNDTLKEEIIGIGSDLPF